MLSLPAAAAQGEKSFLWALPHSSPLISLWELSWVTGDFDIKPALQIMSYLLARCCGLAPAPYSPGSLPPGGMEGASGG